ncbi:dUTP diphosphatase [Clostridium sp. Mt-5]|uniref:dUTP diphosphatase n=1 Tax=Clostridium moutaii TaxID=3240932 RepID=A0ABV4BS10_9CLOT
MDIRQMLADQKNLDDEILSNAGIKEYPLKNMQLALLVELGELANEWQGFKHWKKHKEINMDKLLEEFADCLHFALSLQNNLDTEEFSFEHIQNSYDLMNAIEGSASISKLFIDAYIEISANIKNTSLLLVIIALGLNLGITGEQMEQAYYKKNKVNYKRQREGY